jgi:hypothetical protein
MRRFRFPLWPAALPLLTAALLLAGCKKVDDEDEGPPPRGSSSGPAAAAKPVAKLLPVKGTYTGVVRGKITWEGPEPDLAALTKDLRAKMTTNRDFCLAGKECETSEQVYRIGKNKGLGHVFVWIVPEKGHYFDVPADQLAKFKEDKVRIHQPHCAFLPHAAVLFPFYNRAGKLEPTGQKLVVLNDAMTDQAVGHNAKIQSPENDERNLTLSRGNSESFVLSPDAKEINLSCSIHPWMNAYLRAFDHPYAAVTSVGGEGANKLYEDPASPAFGTYEIKGVPVGAKVRLLAWHESLQYLKSAGGPGGKVITLQPENDESFKVEP